ncbi:TPA: hypothetical protein JS171_004840 [Escherichia coli]|nr:hypothetical protein [Escherichia coli]
MNAVTNDELFDEILGRINHHDVRDDIERRVYEIALASLEAEPAASCIIEDGGMCVDGFGEYVGHSLPDGTHQLYTAPPAPVVPEEATPENVEMLSGYVSTYKLTDSERDIAAGIWNACRTAMLQGKGK